MGFWNKLGIVSKKNYDDLYNMVENIIDENNKLMKLQEDNNDKIKSMISINEKNILDGNKVINEKLDNAEQEIFEKLKESIELNHNCINKIEDGSKKLFDDNKTLTKKLDRIDENILYELDKQENIRKMCDDNKSILEKKVLKSLDSINSSVTISEDEIEKNINICYSEIVNNINSSIKEIDNLNNKIDNLYISLKKSSNLLELLKKDVLKNEDFYITKNIIERTEKNINNIKTDISDLQNMIKILWVNTEVNNLNNNIKTYAHNKKK